MQVDTMTHITDQVRLLPQPAWSLLSWFLRTSRWQEQQLRKGPTAWPETDMVPLLLRAHLLESPTGVTTSWQMTPNPVYYRNRDGWSSL